MLQDYLESKSVLRGFIPDKFFSGNCNGESCSSSNICDSSLCRV